MSTEAEPSYEDLSREELEERLRKVEGTVDDLEDSVEFFKEMFFNLEEIVIGDRMSSVVYEEVDETGSVLDQLEAVDGVADLQEDLVDEKRRRSKQDSLIERKVSMIADETDVDLTDTQVAGEDKIQRLLMYGPDDIADNPSNVHRRARTLLSYAGEVGRAADDQFGTRITIKGPAAHTKLQDVRDENLQSGQVRRVFEKIEELAMDSPRKVQAKTGGDGENVLVVYLDQEEMG